MIIVIQAHDLKYSDKIAQFGCFHFDSKKYFYWFQVSLFKLQNVYKNLNGYKFFSWVSMELKLVTDS